MLSQHKLSLGIDRLQQSHPRVVWLRHSTEERSQDDVIEIPQRRSVPTQSAVGQVPDAW